MLTAKGEIILKKTVKGKIQIYKGKNHVINENDIADVEAELERFEHSVKEAVEEQKAIYDRLNKKEECRECAGIFMAHAMILEDEFLLDEMREMIRGQKKSAEYAVNDVFNSHAELFNRMEDAYMQARGDDIMDVKQEILDILLDTDKISLQGEDPIIVAAVDLTPSEMIMFYSPLLVGVVVREGNKDGHMAIMAESMNLPVLIQCKDINENWEGRSAVIDGYNSCIYIDPTGEIINGLFSE